MEIGREEAPNGSQVKVTADIRNNGRCEDWLFGVNFHLPGAMDWGSGTGIPAHGHISPGTRIDAMEFRGDGEAAFSGYVGSRAIMIKAKLSDGSRLELPVRFPSKALRENFVWLRGFGYFVGYHAVDTEVLWAQAYDRDGNLLHGVRNEEGFFF